MARKLERDIGLGSVLAISIGAMIGSGIFILPALAMELAGPAVVLAYLLAGIVVLPAALSKAEMATAMPKAGGSYLYIERSMGPLVGTIAGLGTWFSLTFKGALALVGGAPYLVLLFDIPVMPVAVGLTIALTILNIVGSKQSGRTQAIMVVIMLVAMAWFVAWSLGAVEAAGFEGFGDAGVEGLLAATGFVFVSYAGVTKVASIAEEIEDPGRNIPRGILGSLLFTTVLYVLVVFVLVGVSPRLDLVGSVTPIADVARETLAQPGVVAVVLAAVLALISTANAGLMSSSRYPFAMSRDKLAPPQFAHISERFQTPTLAIALTGGLTVFLVIGVPIMEIAKLGSAFQILVFILINASVIAFRESEVGEYKPEFKDPLYPWSQTFGMVAGGLLLVQMGWVSIIGAAAIIGTGVAWYYGYARRRIEREGIAMAEMRRRRSDQAAEQTRQHFESTDQYDVMVAVDEALGEERERTLTRLGGAVVRRHRSNMCVARFDRVPYQLSLAQAAEIERPADAAFERRMEVVAGELDVPLSYFEIVGHDLRHSMVNAAANREVDLLIMGVDRPSGWSRRLGQGSGWILSHAPCDVLLVDAESITEGGEVVLVTDREPFEPVKVQIADAVAESLGSRLKLLHNIAENAAETQVETIEAYHQKLAGFCTVEVTSEILRGRTPEQLAAAVSDAGLVVVQNRDAFWEAVRRRQFLGDVRGPKMVFCPKREAQPGIWGRIADRLAF